MARKQFDEERKENILEFLKLRDINELMTGHVVLGFDHPDFDQYLEQTLGNFYELCDESQSYKIDPENERITFNPVEGKMFSLGAFHVIYDILKFSYGVEVEITNYMRSMMDTLIPGIDQKHFGAVTAFKEAKTITLYHYPSHTTNEDK